MSLRTRLLIGMGVVAVVLVVTAALVADRTRTDLLDRVDTQLVSAIPTVRGFGPTDEPGEQSSAGLNSLYVGLVTGPRSVVTIARPNLLGEGDEVPRIPVSRAVAAARGSDLAPFTIDGGPEAPRYRLLAVPTVRGDTLVLGLSLRDVDASMRRLITLEIVATGLVLLILAFVTFWVLRLGVRPIKQMTATATAIAEGDLSRRVPSVRPGTEAGELGAALNTMMGRIEEAFDERTRSEERLRRFVADASHELRTPVTTIRGYAELYRTGGLADDEALRQAMRRTEQESVRMASLIDDLLLLARLDRRRPLDVAPVDLGILGIDAAADARAVDPDRAVTAHVTEAVVVPGDERRLRQVIANLVGNALAHTPAGTPVEVRVGRDDGRALLEVHDDGPGIAPDVLAHAFERFYRADPSRSRASGGTGLGLAIVQAIVDAHGGSVTLDSAPGRGTTVRVELPCERADDAALDDAVVDADDEDTVVDDDEDAVVVADDESVA